MTRGAIFLLAASATLAACAQPPSAAAPRSAVTVPDATAAAPRPVAGYTVRPTPAPPGKPTLETLPGMNATAVTNVLGMPQFRRRDGQVEIWQYRGTGCTLDLFLYTEGSDMRVRYVEPRGQTVQATAAETAQVRACASGLLKSRAGS